MARKFVTLNQFFSYLKYSKLMKHNPCDDFEDHEKIKIPDKEAEFYSNAELDLMLDNISGPYKDRDMLMIEILRNVGLRIDELVKLDREAQFTNKLKVHRKGGKIQYLDISKYMITRLNDYIKKYPGVVDGPLFISRNHRRIHDDTVRKMIKKLALKLGFKVHNIHGMRHTFASNMLNDTGNIKEVQHYLGHECVQTTERYMHIIPEHVEKVINKRNDEQFEKYQQRMSKT
jgi:site-specific recombinase XerD